MNIRVLLLLGCLLAATGQAQESRRELWTWTDANGVTHFSDRPVPGARKVEVATFTPQPSATAPAGGSASARTTPPAARVTYRSLEVWQPENEESFFGADATVTVRVRSDPDLASGHSQDLYLDGRRIEGARNAETYTLENLERGAHSLIAVITDERGSELISSPRRIFHIRQPSVNAPANVGPSLRPPPPAPAPKPGGAPRG